MRLVVILFFFALLIPAPQVNAQDRDERRRRPSHASLDLTIDGFGISIGNSRGVDGLRLNFRDDDLEWVNGINFSIWKPRRNYDAEINGIALGIYGPQAGWINGVAVGVGAVEVDRQMAGIGVGGLALVSGGSVQGIALGGLATVVNRDIDGIGIGGLATVTSGNVRGIGVGGLAFVANGRIEGIGIGGLASVTSGAITGIGVGGLATVTNGSVEGISIGGLASVVERRELMDIDTAQGMLNWPHSGFHAHDGVWVAADDTEFTVRWSLPAASPATAPETPSRSAAWSTSKKTALSPTTPTSLRPHRGK